MPGQSFFGVIAQVLEHNWTKRHHCWRHCCRALQLPFILDLRFSRRWHVAKGIAWLNSAANSLSCALVAQLRVANGRRRLRCFSACLHILSTSIFVQKVRVVAVCSHAPFLLSGTRAFRHARKNRIWSAGACLSATTAFRHHKSDLEPPANSGDIDVYPCHTVLSEGLSTESTSLQ